MDKSYSDLLLEKKEGVHFRRQLVDRNSPLVVLAPHAGGIEPGTGKLALEISGDLFSYYIFEGIQSKGNDELHITSTNFDDPECIELVGSCQYSIAIHGCVGSSDMVFVGGRNSAFRDKLIKGLKSFGFPASIDRTNHQGSNQFNICNKCKTSLGLQIEITESFRSTLFRSLTKAGREHPTNRFYSFSKSIHNICTNYIDEATN